MADNTTDATAEMKRIQAENMKQQLDMMRFQQQMSNQDRIFQTASGVVEKGDNAARSVGDRIAS